MSCDLSVWHIFTVCVFESWCLVIVCLCSLSSSTRERTLFCWINIRTTSNEIDSAINVCVHNIECLFIAKWLSNDLGSDTQQSWRIFLSKHHHTHIRCHVFLSYHHENAFKTRLSFHNSQTHSLYVLFVAISLSLSVSRFRRCCCCFAIWCICQLQLIPSKSIR